jgi:hypothetical protein
MTGQSKMQYNREGFLDKYGQHPHDRVYIRSKRYIIEIIKTLTEKINIDEMFLNYGLK